MSTDEPFPRERFGAPVRRMPRYARRLNLSRHPKVTGKRRMALIGAAVYLVSPIDLVPGFIPVAGQLDDAAAILIAIGIALRSMQPAERTVALAEVGLVAADIDDDLRTIGASYVDGSARREAGKARGGRRHSAGDGGRRWPSVLGCAEPNRTRRRAAVPASRVGGAKERCPARPATRPAHRGRGRRHAPAWVSSSSP